MFSKQLLHLIFSLLAALFLLYHATGCLKEEYSYEGGLPADTTIPADTIVVADTTAAPDTILAIAGCSFCRYATSLSIGEWNFRYDTSFLCGAVSNAVMAPGKDAFTFFGPSACTPGTGLIITAYFDPDTFKGDKAGITSSNVTFSYYDNNSVKDIFSMGPSSRFSITINDYEYLTGIAIGRFNGTVRTATGETALINAGNFKIRF